MSGRELLRRRPLQPAGRKTRSPSHRPAPGSRRSRDPTMWFRLEVQTSPNILRGAVAGRTTREAQRAPPQFRKFQASRHPPVSWFQSPRNRDTSLTADHSRSYPKNAAVYRADAEPKHASASSPREKMRQGSTARQAQFAGLGGGGNRRHVPLLPAHPIVGAHMAGTPDHFASQVQADARIVSEEHVAR